MPPGEDHVNNKMDNSSGSDDLSPPPEDLQNSINVSVSTIAAEPHPPEKIRKKPGRKPGWNKPKDADSANASTNGEASNATPDAPKKRVRRPKDPNAPVVPRSRKRKTESLDVPAALAIAQPQQDLQPRPPPPTEILKSQTPDFGKNEAIQRPLQSFFAPSPTPAVAAPPPPPQATQVQPRTSGQNYDPIRSNYDPIRETTVVQSNPFSAQSSPKPPLLNRASASPSISSLVDPPHHSTASSSVASQSFFNHQQARHQDDKQNSVPASPLFARPPETLPSPAVPAAPPPKMFATSQPVQSNAEVTASVVLNGNGNSATSLSKKPSTSTTTAATSGSSPKARPKEKEKEKDASLFPAPPPLPGSGLMQSNGAEYRAPTVILNIPMIGGEVNKYVNFTRLAEEQYGWDALHPRLAAQRDRLARVAAAGAALERNGDKDSGDDMSLDSDAEGDNSNIEMGGMSDGRTGTDAGGKKVPKKRKLKEDDYDKDDGFVDDSDLIWEEQAAAANDGFFVYSGPLVPETEKPSSDRGDGAAKRGRGGRSRGGAAKVVGASKPGPSRPPKDANLPTTGPGSRGGNINRKPRMTKADKARMDQEKEERERSAASMSAPTNGYGGMIPLSSNLGNTPMVFNQT